MNRARRAHLLAIVSARVVRHCANTWCRMLGTRKWGARWLCHSCHQDARTQHIFTRWDGLFRALAPND